MESLLNVELLPGIVADSSAFGRDVGFVSFVEDKDHVGGAHYQSTAVFGTVVTSDGESHSVLIKMKTRNEAKRKRCRVDSQFHNEIHTYERIVPFLLACSDSAGPPLPRYFYGRNERDGSAERDLIVLENVASPSGYRLNEELFLDYDHLVVAVRAIAKFHGLSYTAKHRDPVGFRRAVAGIEQVDFIFGEKWLKEANALYNFGKRGVDRLLARDGGHVYRDNEHLHRFVEIARDGDNSLRRALRPREPLAVYCQGDFNRNNLMFRYGGGGRRPVDALLFDFGRSKYGSPALDLSFLLYMNATQRTRETRWDDLLDAYCSELRASVPSDVAVPDRTGLNAEMAASALYGLAISLFFLPIMLADAIEQNDIALDERGGDIASEYVADMVKHVVDTGYMNV